VRAERLLEVRPRPQRRFLAAPSRIGHFDPAFVQALPAARDAIRQLDSLGDGTDALAERLRQLLLLSESRSLLNDPEIALAFLQRVHDAVGQEFGKVQPPPEGSSVRLTSLSGPIPVTIRSTADYPLDLRITLESPRLEFIGGSTREVRLTRPVQLLQFPVRATSTGRFPVRVVIQTPLGADVATTNIVVRSTAYNRVALVVTIGAALFLALWWGRRFLRRRT
jgi:hypothetical protein